MEKYKLINGFTKSSVKSVIRAEFKGWATTTSGNCRYRLKTPATTLKCAVGCFIPDDLYNDGMEGSIPSAQFVNSFPEKTFPLTAHGLKAFQGHHDKYAELSTSLEIRAKLDGRQYEPEPLEAQIALLEEWVDNRTVEPQEDEYETAL